MPHFTIYEGEAAIRYQHQQLRREIAQIKAENDRLRAKCGEAVVAQVVAETAAAERLAPPGQSFDSGDCKVTIMAPQKPVALNPLVARARAKLGANSARPAQPTIVQPIDLPPSTQQQTQDEEVDEQLTSQRFSLLEPR